MTPLATQPCEVNAARHVFARRCIQISQAERTSTKRQSDHVKWAFHSNHLHLDYFSTRTVKGGEGRGGAAPGKVPICFSTAPGASPRSPGSEASFRSRPPPRPVSQHGVVNTRRESPRKRASPRPAADSRLWMASLCPAPFHTRTRADARSGGAAWAPR